MKTKDEREANVYTDGDTGSYKQNETTDHHSVMKGRADVKEQIHWLGMK